jgi:hypothetical protein
MQAFLFSCTFVLFALWNIYCVSKSGKWWPSALPRMHCNAMLVYDDLNMHGTIFDALDTYVRGQAPHHCFLTLPADESTDRGSLSRTTTTTTGLCKGTLQGQPTMDEWAWCLMSRSRGSLSSLQSCMMIRIERRRQGHRAPKSILAQVNNCSTAHDLTGGNPISFGALFSFCDRGRAPRAWRGVALLAVRKRVTGSCWVDADLAVGTNI